MSTHKRIRLTQLMRRIIAYQQKWCCAICSELLDPSFDIDHIVALCNGGLDEVNNMQALCANCHRIKTTCRDIRKNDQKLMLAVLERKPIVVSKYFEQFKYKS